MELTPKQQTIELIRGSQRILLCTNQLPDGDSVGSSLALYHALGKIGKDVALVTTGVVPAIFNFLPGIQALTSELGGTQDFIISVSTARAGVERLGYKHLEAENKLNIVITPRQGAFTSEDVSFLHGTVKFDLIIVLDTPDLERLGKLYSQNTSIFFDTPIVNIDHHSGNDYFGKVNWVDLTATSTAEILVSLLESLGREKPLLDPEIATCLLTGITTDTGSFQHSNTTPKAFTVAAQLVAAGANQQEMIQRIYKTKALSTLRLWGKILTEIDEDQLYHFVWSKVTQHDLKSIGAEEAEVGGVVEELLRTAPNIDFALLLVETGGGVRGILRGIEKSVDVSEIARLFSGGGEAGAASFFLANANLDEAEKETVERIREYQRQHRGAGTPPTEEGQFGAIPPIGQPE